MSITKNTHNVGWGGSSMHQTYSNLLKPHLLISHGHVPYKRKELHLINLIGVKFSTTRGSTTAIKDTPNKEHLSIKDKSTRPNSYYTNL